MLLIHLNNCRIAGERIFIVISYQKRNFKDPLEHNIIFFAIDLPLCQTIHKVDLTFMVTLTVHQTYTAQSFRLSLYSLI